MSRAVLASLVFGVGFVVACSGGTTGGGEGNDGGGSTSGGGTEAPGPAPTSTGGTSSSSGAPAPSVGCHLDCACYEPPYHPDEIDCHAACNKLAGWTSDNVCAYFAGTEGVADCERRCAGIRATWTQPNLATFLASEIFGCATLASSCESTKACVQAVTDQQKRVCP
jgi:hypothetical protein